MYLQASLQVKEGGSSLRVREGDVRDRSRGWNADTMNKEMPAASGCWKSQDQVLP